MLLITLTDPWDDEPIVINAEEISSIIKANPLVDDTRETNGHYKIQMKSGLEIAVKESASKILHII